MPFGLANAPGTFQRMMDAVLRGLTWQCCLVYLDDVIIFSKGGVARHVVELAAVLERLKGAGLSLKASKSVRPFGRFLQTEFGTKAVPSSKLLRKTTEWEWGAEQQAAFEQLKEELTARPLLAYPDYTKPFKLVTDASASALARPSCRTKAEAPRDTATQIRQWVRSCRDCGTRKARPKEVIPPLRSLGLGTVGDRWALDVAGPLPVTKRGNRYVIPAVEYATLYAIAVAVPTHAAQDVARFCDLVWVLRPPRGRGVTKLAHRWVGPARITDDAGFDNWRVEFHDTGESLVTHCSFLTSYHCPEGMLEEIARRTTAELGTEDEHHLRDLWKGPVVETEAAETQDGSDEAVRVPSLTPGNREFAPVPTIDDGLVPVISPERNEVVAPVTTRTAERNDGTAPVSTTNEAHEERAPVMTADDDNRRQTPVSTTDDASRSGNAPVSNAPVSTADGVGIREEAPVQTAGSRREAPTTTSGGVETNDTPAVTIDRVHDDDGAHAFEYDSAAAEDGVWRREPRIRRVIRRRREVTDPSRVIGSGVPKGVTRREALRRTPAESREVLRVPFDDEDLGNVDAWATRMATDEPQDSAARRDENSGSRAQKISTGVKRAATRRRQSTMNLLIARVGRCCRHRLRLVVWIGFHVFVCGWFHRVRRRHHNGRRVSGQSSARPNGTNIERQKQSMQCFGHRNTRDIDCGSSSNWKCQLGGVSKQRKLLTYSTSTSSVACKGIATISVDRVDFKSQIAHGDLVRLEGEVIYTGRSSLAVQITGYRHDVEAGKFIHTLSAIMTCVALDENMRPSPGLPKLMDPSDPEYVRKHEEIAAQRKELAARWQAVQEEVDQLPHVSVDMLKTYNYGRSLEVPIPDTLIEVQNSFLPKHLNRNNTIFGGEVLTWMDKVAFRHHLEVEVEVFVGRIGSKERRKSHTGYFTVANLDRSYRMKQISTGLKVDENDQESMRTLLKAQHRWLFDDQERKLLTLEPLSLSTPNSSSPQVTP
ncbi:unnamed protein product [Phytophthora lilii]|uniref:Unnamed protein product n=1 Tax=Phytophthora lilii TaxID=2077276 RepID=A0A9W6XCS6_9STRA|nr:unnamed protein product [Phytophthora lilii]